MHSCTPCRFNTAERVTFYKARVRAQGQSGTEGRAAERTPDLEPKPWCRPALGHLPHAGWRRLMTLENGADKVTGLL